MTRIQLAGCRERTVGPFFREGTTCKLNPAPHPPTGKLPDLFSLRAQPATKTACWHNTMFSEEGRTADELVAEESSFAELMKYLGKDVKEVMPTEVHSLEMPQSSALYQRVEPSEASCWGALLRGDASLCSRGFTLGKGHFKNCLLYTSPSPRDRQKSRMPSSA